MEETKYKWLTLAIPIFFTCIGAAYYLGNDLGKGTMNEKVNKLTGRVNSYELKNTQLKKENEDLLKSNNELYAKISNLKNEVHISNAFIRNEIDSLETQKRNLQDEIDRLYESIPDKIAARATGFVDKGINTDSLSQRETKRIEMLQARVKVINSNLSQLYNCN